VLRARLLRLSFYGMVAALVAYRDWVIYPAEKELMKSSGRGRASER
jgi:hypothetical protein